MAFERKRKREKSETEIAERKLKGVKKRTERTKEKKS